MGKYTLIVIVGFVITFGVLKANLNQVGGRLADNFLAHYERAAARHIANSGARVAVRKLTEGPVSAVTWTDKTMLGGLSSVEVDTIDTNTIGVTSMAKYSGVIDTAGVDTTFVEWWWDTFAKYASFTDISITFTSADTLNGPVHVNGTMYVDGQPVFTALVTSPNMWQQKTSTSDQPQFLGDGNFDTVPASIPLPTPGCSRPRWRIIWATRSTILPVEIAGIPEMARGRRPSRRIPATYLSRFPVTETGISSPRW